MRIRCALALLFLVLTTVVACASPAQFVLGNPVASPRFADTSETILITAKVSNAGGKAGDYTVVLKIKGVVEDTKHVALNAGETDIVAFEVNRKLAGIYNFDINGKVSQFTLSAAPPSVIVPSPVTVPTPVIVPSPPAAPIGATARCRDGTYSYSKNRRGTCSHHGGVAEWLQ